MRTVLVAALAWMAAPVALAQHSGQPADAQRLAAPCAICHGTQGRAATAHIAVLAGMPREHIAAQMRAFRDGKRPATVMHQIAKGYTDPEIDALAAWFAGREPTQ